MKCGQRSCRCQDDPEARHGPYLTVSRVVKGRTRSRYLTGEQAELARRQIEAGQQFRQQVEQYWRACERWADAELDAAAGSDAQGAEKGGSSKSSTPTSSPRSRRL
jgi:predicted oxidoreductase